MIGADGEFRDFPVYWIGEEFQGHRLDRIIRYVSSPDSTVPENKIILLYGSCTPVGEGGCPVPLQIQVTPYCYKRPEDIAAVRRKTYQRESVAERAGP
jgi:hypothetical protein